MCQPLGYFIITSLSSNEGLINYDNKLKLITESVKAIVCSVSLTSSLEMLFKEILASLLSFKYSF